MAKATKTPRKKAVEPVEAPAEIMEKLNVESTLEYAPKSRPKDDRPLVEKFNPKYILVLVLLIAFGVAVYFKINNENKTNVQKLKTTVIPAAIKKVLSNPNSPFEIGAVKETNGVYEFELILDPQGAAKRYTSYITKDGKVLFTSGIKVDAVLGEQTQNTTTPEPKKITCKDVSKTAAPKLTAFIVSKCPYGLQMQRVLKKTIDELPEITNNLYVRYIGSVANGKITSMHGDEEAQENLRQICIREEQKDKYWSYVANYIVAGDTEGSLATAGVDTNLVNACMADTSRGLKYAQIDFDLSNKLSISSSPTLVLNNSQTISEFDFGGRVPNAIKEIVGCSFQTKPDSFNKELSKDAVAASFSQTVSGSNTTNSAANCGN